MIAAGEITMYKYLYPTPEGFSDLWMTCDGDALTGLWFEGSRDTAKHRTDCGERRAPGMEDTIRWLDLYFAGQRPDFTPRYVLRGLTPFRKEVVDLILRIPYGEVVTYGRLAETLARAHSIPKMSARAVGGAVGWNPICLIIPCHRVVGTDGSLTGYGGGIGNKVALLRHEGLDMGRFTVPTRGTAL